MTSGTVILAHRSAGLRKDMAAAIHERNMCVRIEQTGKGNEVLLMQAAMRADAILVDMEIPDVPGEVLIRELRRDIVDPYVLACSRDGSCQAERKALKLGANAYAAEPFSTARMCELLQEQIALRAERGETESGFLAERELQRLFMEQGIPSSLKGYVYLKHAIRMLLSGQAEFDRIGDLYDRISLRYGCRRSAVERGIRYVIRLCWQRANAQETKIPSNKEFLAMLLEESAAERQAVFKPRVSVFCGNRRVFR